MIVFFLLELLFYKDNIEFFSTITQKSSLLDPKRMYESVTIGDSHMKHDCNRLAICTRCYYHVFKGNSEMKQTTQRLSPGSPQDLSFGMFNNN